MHAGEERARERGEGAPEADGEREPPRTAPEVVLNTSIGAFTVELYWKHALKTCQNFIELARQEYYDGVPFHHIIAGFMIRAATPPAPGAGARPSGAASSRTRSPASSNTRARGSYRSQ